LAAKKWLISSIRVRRKATLEKMISLRFGSSFPHACPLDVDADEIFLRKPVGQPHRVLSLSASQFQDNGMFIFEKGTPASL